MTMPTIHITSARLAVTRRRAIAVRLTRWLRMQGVSASHVIVRFAEEEKNSVFSGGLPVEAVSAGAGGPPSAFVLCRISQDRSERFRAELASELVGALQVEGLIPFVYIEFQATSPKDVYLLVDGCLCRADQEMTVL